MSIIRKIIYLFVDAIRWPELRVLGRGYDRFRQDCEARFKSAVEKVPFYAERNIDGSNVNSEQFVLSKRLLKENFEKLRNPSFQGKFRRNTSGGSTGEPACFLQDTTYDRYVSLAIRYYYENFLGVDVRPLKKVIIWGSESDIVNWSFGYRARVKAWLFNAKYFNAFNLTDEVIADIIAYIISNNVRFVRGYASSLKAIGSFIVRNKMSNVRVDYIVSSAEKITREDRELLERAFHAKVFDVYGSREAGMIAGSCSAGNYHFITFNHKIKIAGPDGAGSNEFPILVSTLNNLVMPLVNYQIGDASESKLVACKCGSSLPAVSGISGRTSDNFVRLDGSLIHGEYFTHLLYFDPRIRKFQFVQEQVGTIVLNVEPSPEVLDSERFSSQLLAELKSKIDLAMRSTVDLKIHVGPISPTKHGKHLYTISKVETQ